MYKAFAIKIIRETKAKLEQTLPNETKKGFMKTNDRKVL